MTEPGRLEVRRFRAEYHVPADHPAPGAVRARLDAAVRGRLPRALAAALERVLPADDPGVWLIRRLHVDVDVHAAWDDATLVRAWAAQATRSLARALAAAREDAGTPVSAAAGDALHFADRAAYLARFLADLAVGDAWGRWYYAAFDGLRPLPESAAIRTAVLDDAATGARALLALAATDRARVLSALRPNDARRVLEGIAAGTAAAAPWTALWRAWETLPPHAPAADAEERAALELYLRACLADAGAAGTGLRDAARGLARLARLLGEADAPAADRLLRGLRAGGPGALLAAAPRDADALAPLRAAPPGWVEAVARTLAGTAAPSVQGGAPAVRSTPFGAAFLLLPFLGALPLDEAVDGWPAAGATPAAAAVRLLLAAKTLGRAHAVRVFWDPLVRDAAGVHPSLAPAVVRAWIRALPRHALPRLLHVLAAWRLARGHANARTLALWSEPLPGAPAAVLLDAPSALWLWARGHPPGRPAAAAAHAATWLAAAGLAPETVLADAAFREAGAVLPGLAEADAAAAAADPRVAAVLARRPRLRGDLDYLAAPALGLPRAADLALSVAAQGVLREFAARLPGFAASSLPYLRANFLDLGAVVEAEPERWIVRLGRPPLQFVLAASGTPRGVHHPHWLPHDVVLCQEAA